MLFSVNVGIMYGYTDRTTEMCTEDVIEDAIGGTCRSRGCTKLYLPIHHITSIDYRTLQEERVG